MYKRQYYVSAGLFLGLITILDDSLELALGVHFATNFAGATLFSFDGGVLQTDTIVRVLSIDANIATLTFFISAIIFIIVCNKKYKWPSYKTLFDNIDFNQKPQIDITENLL